MDTPIRKRVELLPWYEHMTESVPSMILFIIISFAALPILIIYGALLPLFPTNCSKTDMRYKR